MGAELRDGGSGKAVRASPLTGPDAAPSSRGAKATRDLVREWLVPCPNKVPRCARDDAGVSRHPERLERRGDPPQHPPPDHASAVELEALLIEQVRGRGMN